MDHSLGSDRDTRDGERKYSSPNRILARSFRLSRDAWKEKHQRVQEKLKKERKLAAERGLSRDRWREKCELADERTQAAELLVSQQAVELEQLRKRQAALEAGLAKKK